MSLYEIGLSNLIMCYLGINIVIQQDGVVTFLLSAEVKVTDFVTYVRFCTGIIIWALCCCYYCAFQMYVCKPKIWHKTQKRGVFILPICASIMSNKITRWTGLEFIQCKRMAKFRQRCRLTTGNVTGQSINLVFLITSQIPFFMLSV